MYTTNLYYVQGVQIVMIIIASTTCFLSKPTPQKKCGGTALVHVTVTVVGALWLLVDVSNSFQTCDRCYVTI